MSISIARLFRTGLIAAALFAATGLASAKSKAAAKTETATPAALVDINTASQKDLESIKGIGSASAKKIIAHRPYASVEDLSRSGISARTIENIKPLVTASAVSAAPAPASKAAASGEPAAGTSAAKRAKREAAATGVPASSPTASSVAATPPSPGMVWVNTSTKVFHREGDPWYGKTKHGKWMTEADATAAGYRAARSGAAAPKSQ